MPINCRYRVGGMTLIKPSKKWIKFTSFVAVAVFSALVLTSFQNCGNFKSADLSEGTSSSRLSLPTPDCYFNGEFIPPRQYVDAFLNSTETNSCVSERRQCVSGAMTGSFAYATCSMGGNAACLFDGRTIPHGSQVPAYQNSTVANGAVCVGEMRSCNNGVLSGSFNYNNCEVSAPASCLFDGQTIPHGDVVKAFESSSTPPGVNCTSETRQCLNGRLSGSFSYSSCLVDEYQSCLFDGRTISHGQRVIAFQSSNGTCTSEVRICNNGTMSGSYQFAGCAPSAPTSCLFGGRSIASGEYVAAYKEPYVAEGRTCSTENRLCLNGVLSGTFQNDSCVVMGIASEFVYQGNPYVLSLNMPHYIAPKLPQNFSGTCSVSPSLPPGLDLDPRTCAVVGSPSTLANSADYMVTAYSSSGSTTARLTLSVLYQPPSLSFPSMSYYFTKGTAISPIVASNSGGSIVSCEVSPSLPTGLNLNPLSCMISGTPTSVITTSSFSITATNMSGLKNTVAINITVRDVGPSFSYGSTSFSFPRGTAITPLVATVSGGAILNCTVVPALPTGLSLNSSNCTISGTPTAVTAQRNYQVTATNSGGNQGVLISIVINEIVPSLNYSDSPYTFTRGNAISALVPTNSGGPITSCSIAPTLPTGLVMNTSTCALSGTPIAAQGATNYIVTATNSVGSKGTTISITVLDMLPSIAYPASSYIFEKNKPIPTLAVSNSGGAITSCAITPALVNGLIFNTTNCAISGTPTAISNAVSHTVTAYSTGGNKSTTLTIAVADNAPAFTYPVNPAIYNRGVAITPNTPTNSGGGIISCSITPSLPAGLSFNTTTCEITGTPTEARGSAVYKVTAANGNYNATYNLTLQVKDYAPDIDINPKQFIFERGKTITAIATANTGGVVTECKLNTALPAGLELKLNNGACIIQGTPTANKAETEYILIGKNETGEDAVTIKISVIDPPTP